MLIWKVAATIQPGDHNDASARDVYRHPKPMIPHLRKIHGACRMAAIVDLSCFATNTTNPSIGIRKILRKAAVQAQCPPAPDIRLLIMKVDDKNSDAVIPHMMALKAFCCSGIGQR